MNVIKIIAGVSLLIPFILLDTIFLTCLIVNLFSDGAGGMPQEESMIYGLTRWLLRKMGWIKSRKVPSMKSALAVSPDTLSDTTSTQKVHTSWVGQIVRVVVWTGVAILVVAFFLLVSFD